MCGVERFIDDVGVETFDSDKEDSTLFYFK
jgi:hypothetical protein